MADPEVRYREMTTTVVRGLENRSRAKWESQGWEYVGETQLPMLRTRLAFRRPKGKPPWLVIALASGAGLALAAVIVVMSILESSGQLEPEAASPSSTAAATQPVPQSTATLSNIRPDDDDVYRGPSYEIVAVDAGQSAARLNQYWVHSPGLDINGAAYREQVRLILADISRVEGSPRFFAEIVVHEEIALAESPSTYDDFIDEYGVDYAVNEIPRLEVRGWVASYAGGFDYDTGDAADSFEIVWWPAGTPEFEAWRP